MGTSVRESEVEGNYLGVPEQIPEIDNLGGWGQVSGSEFEGKSVAIPMRIPQIGNLGRWEHVAGRVNLRGNL